MRSPWWIMILKLCVSVTLFSRGWLTWRWDSPIRSLVWNEQWWGNKIDWQAFANHSDQIITNGLGGLGLALMAGAAVPWLIHIKWTRWLLLPMSLVLFLDAFGRYIDSGHQFAMSIEHTLQWGCPLLLFAFACGNKREKIHRAAVYMTIATFVGHGLYAVGFHPVPLKFQTMTASLLKLNESGVLYFLKIVGYLDFLAAIALLIPPFRSLAILYMILWGAATALARVISGPTFDPWFWETLVRSSHWMIPCLLYFDHDFSSKLRKFPWKIASKSF